MDEDRIQTIMKKLLRSLLLVTAILSLLVAIATFPMEAQAKGRAKTYQIVKKSPEAALFGDVGEKIGSPQEYIVDDPSVILPQPAEDGVLLLDDDVMKQKGVYPVQLQTVKFVLGTARMASFILGALTLGGWWFWTRRLRRAPTQTS